ncbi:MAG: SPOR domain-containing protein [Desulfobacterales bacterium]|jgi:cell division septation protein DedD
MAKEEKTPSSKQPSSKKQTRKGLIPWIGVTLFACAWMFVLGIFVGRETAPVRFDIEKLQNELTALKERVVKKELDQYNIDSNADVTKTKMKFYEALKKTGRDDRLNDNMIKQQKKSISEKSASLSKVKMPGHIDGLAQKEKKSGFKKSPKATPPAVGKQDPAGKNVTIQVASMKASSDADKLVSKLKKEGYPAYRTIGKIPGKGIWFRVRVGYFKNRTEAGLMLKRLKKEKIEAVIVQR